MSTNPFRRSSLRGSGGSNPSIPVVGTVDAQHAFDLPLSVDTKVPNTNQKHVNFASPPAVPISPVSYPPSSPESNRLSPVFVTATPVSIAPTAYSRAIQSDPFTAEAETDEDDGAIAEALQNTKANAEIAIPRRPDAADAVKNTLSKFAGAPRRSDGAGNKGSQQAPPIATTRQTMDVDAFKRLLLTGDSGANMLSASRELDTSSARQTEVSMANSDMGRSAVLAPFSFSKNDTMIKDNSDTSSDEELALDPSQQSTTQSGNGEGRKKPPPPRSRHGRAIREESPATRTVVNEGASAMASPGYYALEEPESLRQPPALPLARKKSTKSNAVSARNVPFTPGLTGDRGSATTSTESLPPRAPPVPRARRPISMVERRPSSDLPSTMEEPDSPDIAVSAGRKSSDTKPLPPPPRHTPASKRISMGLAAPSPPPPPPPPPPRKGRASSRSSIDSQRPSLTSLPLNTDSTRSSGEYLRADNDSHQASIGSSANDILADLAALQREVDEARRRAGR